MSLKGRNAAGAGGMNQNVRPEEDVREDTTTTTQQETLTMPPIPE